MKQFEERLLDELAELIEKKQELELQLTLVKEEYKKVMAAYLAYKNTNIKLVEGEQK